MTKFVFCFLGAFQVRLEATSVTDFHLDKVRALLAYLVLEPGEPRAQCWLRCCGRRSATSRRSADLRNSLHRLRQAFDAVEPGSSNSLLMISRQSICFKPECADVDVHDFLTVVSNAQSAASAVDLDQLEKAVALYRGELLSGFGVADAPAFEEWLLLRRELLHQRALMAFHMLSTAYETAGSYDRAYTLAGRLLIHDPYRAKRPIVSSCGCWPTWGSPTVRSNNWNGYANCCAKRWMLTRTHRRWHWRSRLWRVSLARRKMTR